MVKEGANKYSYSLVVVVGTVVAVLVAGIFIIKPLWDTSSKLQTEKKAADTQLSVMKGRLDVLNKLSDQKEQLVKDSDTVAKALPTQDEVGRLFIQLDSLATASGGSLKSVFKNTSIVTTTASAGIVEQEYSIPLEMPSYFALKQFISNAESALRLLSISNLKIDVNDKGALSVSMIAKSYVRAE